MADSRDYGKNLARTIRMDAHPQHHRSPTRHLLALLALAIVACGGGDASTNPTPVAIVGSWTLQSYNGHPLPYTVVQIGEDKAELIAGVINFAAGGSYTTSVNIRYTEAGVVSTDTTSDAGTYTQNGTAVTLKSNDPSSTDITAALSGSSLTLGEQGNVFVFVKS